MKKMKRLFTAMLTALCMIVALLPTTAFAQENVFYVGTESELIAAVNQINAADGGEFVIKLSDNISANKKIEFLKNKTTLYGQGYTLIPNGGLSVKNEGAVLNLGSDDGADSLVISGENSRRTTAMISCENAILNMYSGVVIKDADNGGGAAGSGVFVFGTFNMYGGTITGCDGSMIGLGGAVSVNKGTFNMYDGSITKNTVTGYGGYGGGVLIYTDRGYECTFNMYGGSIVDNYASGCGGGVCLYEYNAPASFNMYGGSLENNRTSDVGGGIYFNNDGLNIASSKANPAVIQQNKKVESVDEETGTANNIYVYTGQTIKIGKLQDGCKIGISEEVSKDDITFTAGYEQNNKGVHPSRYFTSDDSEYLTDYIRNEDMTEVRLAKGAIITFKVQNGTWSDGTTGDRIVFVNYAAGTSEGTLSDSEIPTGMLPIEGYDEPGAWNSEINKTVSEEMTYIYSFTKNTADSGDSSDSSDSPDVSDPGETETPKTGDESNIALWFAVMITACAVLSGIAVCNKNKKSTK